MKLDWNPENSITEVDAALADKNGAISSMQLVKSGEGYYVLLTLNWRKGDLFLATTRVRTEPREFKHLGRLIEHIEVNYPSVRTLTILLK